MVTFLNIDAPALIAGILSALVCGLLGNILLLRRQALLGDAISHVVLPGLVLSFTLAGTSTAAYFGGAALAALVAVGLIALFTRIGRVNNDAATGVVFSSFFALGIVLLSITGAENTNFDIHTVLFGHLEGNLWLSVTAPADLLQWRTWQELPPAIGHLAVVLVLVLVIGAIAFKELRVLAFDPLFIAVSGGPHRHVAAIVIVLTALAAVAAFQAVGAILVVAMFVCPAATARCLTDRLDTQIMLSAIVAVLAAVLGYLSAAFGPQLVGLQGSVNAAGVIVIVAGLMQLAAMLAGPARHGRDRALQ